MHEDKLAGVEYLDAFRESFVRETPGVNHVLESIKDYLADAKRPFNLGLHLGGTPFQHKVWQALQAIPAGETLTYGTLAEHIGSGARAVGNACRANPCPLVVPCHRVVAVNGLGGFAGERHGKKLEIKRWLLRHEAGL
ncbi:MAG: methylated-DNA--[protein]-cysteine S-methyltransferase [Candidatus Thiodiazotropha sp. (ex Semelilucina semeliformis)]|nr:methylated-DNA--[protein]-cysteine S-methyltransferase [Candidatus Thiodiazotropha sp. (ex Myrtea spinifera)]MCU7806661.1 methylated-DNA--[protein]-cysteine S-methyltransferase [Candidatus Thiodiazotropha sp. (ex Semelilucina semeliformis)]MCU7829092.1 methylated-DNA--[protein]-cysteine S-methyltransferase [Candidatus Thiodiazotropha sp. (ex Myrtea sp. 'scaly one' KF741663)]